MTTLSISSTKPRQVIDISSQVNSAIESSSVSSGICHLHLTHTTGALTTADLDPGTETDYIKALAAITPKLNFTHPHDPAHFPDHFLSSLIGTSISLPFQDHKLTLGTWQKVVMFEFSGPRKREIIVSVVSHK